MLMLENGKVSKKLQEILVNKDKFRADLRALETVQLIDSILSLGVKDPEEVVPKMTSET